MPSQDSKFYVTAPLLWQMVLGLGALGLDVDALLNEVGLSTDALRNPEARFNPELGLSLVRLAIRVSGDDNLGLRLAMLYEPGAFGVLDYLAQSARDLREAVELLCRYERIHQNGMRTELSIDGDRCNIAHVMLHPYALPRQVSENTLANLVAIGRKLTGIDYTPLEVAFAHPPPPDTREHERFFRCPLLWQATQDVLSIPAALLDAPLRKPNPGLTHVLEQHARGLLLKLPVHGSLSEQVRKKIFEALPRGTITLEALAASLRIAPRTLQRRLRDEGTSHANLIDELRRELAEDYLHRSELGTEDVAVLLGFSDSRAFRRAFKRWTGRSPAYFRSDRPDDRNHRNEPASQADRRTARTDFARSHTGPVARRLKRSRSSLQ